MLSNNISTELLGLKGIIIKSVNQKEKLTTIEIEMEVSEQCCPSCNAVTTKIHDYREQTIKDTPAFGKNIILILKKRRYKCPNCGKQFYEKNTFLPRYHRMTNRLPALVIDKLHEERSFSSVAREVNLSTNTVIRIFDLVNYQKPELSEVLAIDEFKGNAGHEKYQCIITDPKNGIVLDVLPKRYSHYLISYFKDMERSHVKFFVSDMWKPYSDLAFNFLRNATQVVDKYHFIRQVVWAFEAIRKQEQKKFSKSHRIYFKRSRSLLIKQWDWLSDEQKQQVNVMLYASPTLSSAYFLKERFFKIFKADSHDEAKSLFKEWIEEALDSSIDTFRACAKTFINWAPGILNSFDCPYTNGFTEGCNNKIKVLKRNAYGIRNFNRFRNRILHIFSHQKLENQKSSAA